MIQKNVNKHKIINDPVHGFIRIPTELVFDLLEHPIFQRLRRIKQLGLTYYVYPGATHTRFQHTIGAMHLMSQAISHLREKKIEINEQEEEAVLIAILLHDIGHGPFSHALEHSLIEGILHEDLSALLMKKLNNEYGGKLEMALQIFNNKYKKKFLHQLISSQLDLDRMDYLKRDSFYSGVVEGNIGTDRIIKMLTVVNDELAIEAKGLYSIEKFLLARRLMYWQVYYHKTVIASELLLVKTLRRAKFLAQNGIKVWGTPALEFFLHKKTNNSDLNDPRDITLNHFLELDDSDILVSAKQWKRSSDYILKFLSEGIINRKLPHVHVSKEKVSPETINVVKSELMEKLGINKVDVEYLVTTDIITNHAYTPTSNKINILFSNGDVKDIAEVSDVLNISNLNKANNKHIFAYPKLTF